MFRFGRSWRLPDGGRAWVSGPLWWPFAWGGIGLLFWVLIGWWLWFFAQMGLVVISLFLWGWVTYANHWHGHHYRPYPLYLGTGLWVLDQTE
jgi:hypothetical protein